MNNENNTPKNSPADVSPTTTPVTAQSEVPGQVVTPNPEVPSQVVTPTEAPQKSRQKLIAIGAVVLLVVGVVGVIAVVAGRKSSLNLDTSGLQSLANDRVLVRYEENGAFERDEAGNIKKIKGDDGDKSVRKKSFDVRIDAKGQSRDVSLTDKTTSFGLGKQNAKDVLYSITCSVPKSGQTGADEASYLAQLYDLEGKPVDQYKWTDNDGNRPLNWSGACDDYFDLETSTVLDFTPRNFAKERIDTLNYRVAATVDGNKQVVDTETSTDLDIPLGFSPDQKKFMYARISAKQVTEGCSGETVNLPYKIPDYEGSINELRVYDLVNKKDTLLGTEKSFSTDTYPVNIGSLGQFSTDGTKYYLKEGGHGGCRDRMNSPIRIPYVDLTTNTFKTLMAPAGKNYVEYCSTDDGKFILENGYGINSSKGKTEPKEEIPAPSILNTQDGTTYEDSGLTKAFTCANTNRLGNVFGGLDVTERDGIDADITGVSFFDPATKKATSATLDMPVTGRNYTLSLTKSNKVGYLNYDTYSGANNSVRDRKTVLIDLETGKTEVVPFADIVL